MDISEEYVKMCKEAKEIQELWIPKEGDYTDTGIVFPHELKYSIKYLKESAKWIPKIDQLFEMIDWNILNNISFRKEKDGFCILDATYGVEDNPYLGGSKTSFEKGFLMLIMSFNYKKYWNSEKTIWESRY